MILESIKSASVKYWARKKRAGRLFWPPVALDLEKSIKKYELNYKRYLNLLKMGRFDSIKK